MNRKLVIGAVAGAAAVAMAYGGATYSAWSDFGDITDNQAAAGMLKLDVHRINRGMNLARGTLMPGQGAIHEVYFAGNDAGSAPDGTLYVTVKNITSVDGCTARSENAVDKCEERHNGEFAEQATMQVMTYLPVTPGDHAKPRCEASVKPSKGTTLDTSSFTDLAAFEGHQVEVADLTPGQGVCLWFELSMPSGAGNAVQGDSARFDVVFDLVQVH